MTDEKKPTPSAANEDFGFGDEDYFGFGTEPVSPSEAVRRYKASRARRALLDPQAAPQRVVRYSLAMGPVTLGPDGKRVTLEKRVMAPFKAERIAIQAIDTPFPWWVTFLTRLFGWVRVPWLISKWDEGEEGNVLQLRVIRPIDYLGAWAYRAAQRRALGTARLVSVRVGRAESLLGDVAAAEFTADPIALALPTATVDQAIEVSFEGEGGPFQVVIMGVTLE